MKIDPENVVARMDTCGCVGALVGVFFILSVILIVLYTFAH
jgi:hypothetical protein